MRMPRVNEFDGLRGLLALWVVMSHIISLCGFATLILPHGLDWLWHEFASAQSAVDTFMILSGFAITFLLHGFTRSYTSFIVSRFFRLYPVYLVCLGGGIGATFLMPSILRTAPWRNNFYFIILESISASEQFRLGAHIVWHLTLLNGLLPRQILPNAAGTLLPPAWSITLEWQYYLVAPFLSRLLRTPIVIFLVAVVAWVTLRLALIWQNPQFAFLPAALPLFCVGIGSFYLFKILCGLDNDNVVINPVVVATMLAASVLVGWHPVALIAWSVAFGSVVIRGTGLFANAFKVVGSFLLTANMQWLGSVSYPLYLVHWPLLILLLRVTLYFRPTVDQYSTALLMLIVGIPLQLLAAWCLHLWVETPCMALGKRLSQRF